MFLCLGKLRCKSSQGRLVLRLGEGVHLGEGVRLGMGMYA